MFVHSYLTQKFIILPAIYGIQSTKSTHSTYYCTGDMNTLTLVLFYVIISTCLALSESTTQKNVAFYDICFLCVLAYRATLFSPEKEERNIGRRKKTILFFQRFGRLSFACNPHNTARQNSEPRVVACPRYTGRPRQSDPSRVEVPQVLPERVLEVVVEEGPGRLWGESLKKETRSGPARQKKTAKDLSFTKPGETATLPTECAARGGSTIRKPGRCSTTSVSAIRATNGENTTRLCGYCEGEPGGSPSIGVRIDNFVFACFSLDCTLT